MKTRRATTRQCRNLRSVQNSLVSGRSCGATGAGTRKSAGAVLFALVMLCLAVGAPRVHAVELVGYDLRIGQTWIGNGYRTDGSGAAVQGSDVSPIRLLAGAGFPLRIRETLLVTPAIDFYLQEYLATPNGKVVPTQIETGTAAGDLATTLGILVSAPVTREWRVGENLRLGAGGGIALLIRLPIGPIEGSDTGPLWDYFYAGVRFLYPEAQGTLTYELSNRIEVGGMLRLLLPVHSLWSEYDVPAWDATMIALQASFRYLR